MINKNILDLIVGELDAYKRATLKVNPSYAPTQWEILDLIDMYWVDKFRDGDTTLSGWKRVFYNIVFNPTLVASKMIDFDTKDVQVKAVEGVSYYPAWFFGRDLNDYMRVKNFGAFLNELVYAFPKYGSIVLKKVGDTVFNVPLRNLAWDIDVNDLHDTNFIIEKHLFTPTALRRTKWDKTAIEEAIKMASGDASDSVAEDAPKSSISKEKRVQVYERFGAVEGEKSNYFCISQEGVVLYQTHFDDVSDIYRKLDWDKIPGRTLGRGTVEKLFETQIQINRVANYKTEGLNWSSKHLFQTRDTTFGKNLIADVENGDVLNPSSEITPIAMEERNLSAYVTEENRWDRLVQNLTFAYPGITGERSPAGMPLGTNQAQIVQASEFFDLKREDLGLMLKEIIYDWIIPTFKRKNAYEHVVMVQDFSDSEISKIREMLSNHRSNQDIINYIIKSGKFPDDKATQLIKDLAKQKQDKEKEITIPANFYDNLRYKIDVVLTNEQFDVSARMATLQTVLGLLNSQPGILSNPNTKVVFYKLLNIAGFSPTDLGIDTMATPDQTMPDLSPAGSLAKTAPMSRISGKVLTKV